MTPDACAECVGLRVVVGLLATTTAVGAGVMLSGLLPYIVASVRHHFIQSSYNKRHMICACLAHASTHPDTNARRCSTSTPCLKRYQLAAASGLSLVANNDVAPVKLHTVEFLYCPLCPSIIQLGVGRKGKHTEHRTWHRQPSAGSSNW